MNPYYHTTESIRNVVREDLLPELNKDIEQIFFYGAGCDSELKNAVVRDALNSSFPHADINIYHDLLGAARACFLRDPGIACILGTGSNSCLYDGSEIIEHIPSLAFILGDEGSAGYFGKKLINKYYRYELPDDLRKALESDYNMDLDHITKGLCMMARKKVGLLRSYGSFLGEHADHPLIVKMLYDEGSEFYLAYSSQIY
ncbi:MAG: hypothetical protein U5J63_11970 [Fodinibius sp.]|nr:hypothetical protein [Fodinibius sp.]